MDEIEKVRKANGITRAAIYRRAGHDKETYRRLENGLNGGFVATLENLSKALDEILAEQAVASE